MSDLSPKALGKFHDLWVLLIGFGLTTVAGGVLSYRWQEQSARNRSRETLQESQRIQATGVYEEVSKLLDRRLFRWRELFWAVERADSTEVVTRARQDYRSVVIDWNSSLNRNQAMLCRYFGFHAGSKFLHMSSTFRTLHVEISRHIGIPHVDSAALKALSAQADDLNREIFSFNNSAVEQIRLGAVGASVPGDTLDTKCATLNTK